MNEQPKKEKSEIEKTQAFLNEYSSLCEKHGYQIVVVPAYRSRDDGTWSTVLQISVGKLPKQEDKYEQRK